MAAEDVKQQQLLALASQAFNKQKRGENLTKAELSALEKFECQQNEKRGKEWVLRLPKGVYADWAGRQHKVLDDQARLYGIPLVGRTLNLPLIVKWYHDFFATHRIALSELVKGDNAVAGEEQTLKGQLLAEQIEERRKRNLLLQTKVDLDAELVLPRETIHLAHVEAATILRAAQEQLDKRFGQDAGDIVRHALDNVERLFTEAADAAANES